VEGPRDEYGGAKPDWAAKITGHCSRETTSDGRPYHQDATWTTSQSRHVIDPRGIVTNDEVVQRRRGDPHLKRTWWTEESTGTASGLWLQTGADGELLLPIVLSRTGGSKCSVSKCKFF